MPQLVSASDYQPINYRGLPGLVEFTNADGLNCPVNCGQAAACTLLNYMGLIQPDPSQTDQIMKEIETAHPPDNLGGRFGTSRRRIERILGAYGVEPTVIAGEENFRQMLHLGNPMIVMIGLTVRKILGISIPSGHWMVAYGYDDDFVYLTNWGRMPWEDFRQGWNGLVARLIRMRNIALMGTVYLPEPSPTQLPIV